MTGPCFVDSNVLVYWRDARDPEKQARASEWLDLLWREQRGRISVQVLSEFYSVMTGKLGGRISPDEAWRDVVAFLSWAPQPIDAELLWKARDVQIRHQLNWWDAQIVAAAQLQGCALLLTEDLQDRAEYGGVVVQNPFTLGVEEERSAYKALPRLESRHRGRGRPRKNPPRVAASS
jgi:predicted nucleic acid-binding protein